MRARLLTGLASACLLLACSERAPEGPQVLEVRPASGSNTEAMPIEIIGDNFLAVPHANYDDEKQAFSDISFAARLGSHALAEVTYRGRSLLTAVVPAGLPPGSYDLEVRAPPDLGRQATLAGAFTVLGPGDGGPPTELGPTDGGPPEGGAPDVTPGQVVAKLLDDPFGDKTPFCFVFKYDGSVYLGPNQSGTGAVRCDPDGSAPTSVTFSFPADGVGNASQNTAGAPYPSIGRSGCTANTHQCGPDNEDGRGVFTAGFIGGQEWLVIAGGRTAGDLDYVYMTQDTDASLDFRYVDLAPVMGPQTRGSSAMHVHGDRLYMGFPDTGGKRPYLVVLKVTPGVPGLDAVAPAETENLGADKMPGVGLSAAMSMIDAIVDFNDRVYVANNGGCLRSTTAQPGSYATTPADWAACSPSAATYTGKTAVTTNKVSEIEPADKAFPQLAVLGGRLYAGRNTVDGPQLWVCDPAASGEAADCDPGDWSLLAANTQGDVELSQFNNPNNTAVALVAATSQHLYVGFDNAQDGIVVLRSSNAAPTTIADFEGEKGCPASAHPATCPGIGDNGLGQATNTRILHGVVLEFAGARFVYLAVGDGTGPVSVHRIRD